MLEIDVANVINYSRREAFPLELESVSHAISARAESAGFRQAGDCKVQADASQIRARTTLLLGAAMAVVGVLLLSR